MRRFSQRNSLVTLNEINVTPLLDLAFVLLIIFVITRPAMEPSMQMKLPDVGKTATSKQINPKDIRLVEISANGSVRLAGRPTNFQQLETELRDTFKKNPSLVVNIRADKSSDWEYGTKVVHLCLRNGITQVAFQVAGDK